MKEFITRLLNFIPFLKHSTKAPESNFGFGSVSEYTDFKKSILPYLAVVLLLVGVGVTVYQVQRQQEIRGRAQTTSSLALTNQKVVLGVSVDPNLLADPNYNSTLIARGFRSLTPENVMKWDAIHPNNDTTNPTADYNYNFAPIDTIVNYAQTHGMQVRGHSLLWHYQNPVWLTTIASNPATTRDQMIKILQDHITKVMTRYKGKVQSYDVVNEVIDDSGNLRNTFWLQKIGTDYIDIAFQTARAVDPKAKLFINDYGIEAANTKSDKLYSIVSSMKSRGIPIDGVGFQAHLGTSSPSSFSQNISRFSQLGLDIALTEVDVTSSSNQASTYATIAIICQNNPNCHNFTIWGVTDLYSWRSSENPLLFDRNYAPKPAYYEVQKALGFGGKTIKIYAVGTPASGIYPIMVLKINGSVAATFSNIQGNPSTRAFQEFTYVHPSLVPISQIQVEFTNDGTAGGEDRNLTVDKITLDGIAYETENESTYSTGTWTQDVNCGPGYKKSETLNCTGYFAYNPLPNYSPNGNFDQYSCQEFRGHACDINANFQPIDVHIYVDGPAGAGGQLIGITKADIVRDLNYPGSNPSTEGLISLYNCGGQNAVGWRLPFPINLLDGREHTYYAYGINTPPGENSQFTYYYPPGTPNINPPYYGSTTPYRFTCTAPTPTPTHIPTPLPPTPTPTSTPVPPTPTKIPTSIPTPSATPIPPSPTPTRTPTPVPPTFTPTPTTPTSIIACSVGTISLTPTSLKGVTFITKNGATINNVKWYLDGVLKGTTYTSTYEYTFYNLQPGSVHFVRSEATYNTNQILDCGTTQAVLPTPTLSPTPTQMLATNTPIPPSATGIPSPTPKKLGDVDGDGHVTIADFNEVLGYFGRSQTNPYLDADLDRSGKVWIEDFNEVLGNFGK